MHREPATHRPAHPRRPLAQPYQRHGIARRLLDFVLRYAAETACRAVYLHVASFNLPALAFYQRAGFQELAVLPNFYTIRSRREGGAGRAAQGGCSARTVLCPSGWLAGRLICLFPA